MTNRGSIWVASVTVAIPSRGGTFGDNTFLLAVGPDKACHKVVEKKLRDDFNELRGASNLSFFHSGIGRNIVLHGDIYCAMMDTPEMRSNTGLTAHNSNIHPRWRHLSCFAGNQFWSLVSCTECYSARLSRQIREEPCLVCTEWNMLATGDLLRGPLPLLYPQEECDPNHGREGMGVREMRFATLLEQSKKTCENVYTEEWPKKIGRGAIGDPIYISGGLDRGATGSWSLPRRDGKDGSSWEEDDDWKEKVDCYCVFLPRFSPDDDGSGKLHIQEGYYYIITSNWTERLIAEWELCHTRTTERVKWNVIEQHAMKRLKNVFGSMVKSIYNVYARIYIFWSSHSLSPRWLDVCRVMLNQIQSRRWFLSQSIEQGLLLLRWVVVKKGDEFAGHVVVFCNQHKLIHKAAMNSLFEQLSNACRNLIQRWKQR